MFIQTQPQRSPLRLALMALAVGAAAWVAWAGFARMGGEAAAPTPLAAEPRSSAPAAARQLAPFPAVQLALIEIDTEADQAVIEVEARRATYTLEQDVFPGVRLLSIGSDRIVLAFGGSTRTLYLPQAAPAGTPAPEPTDIAERNRPIEVARLTTARPKAAEALLREVHLAPQARGGFRVEEVVPDSQYDKLGLRRGDMIYSIDTPAMSAVDENSMIALMLQTTIEIDIYRDGTPMRLRYALNTEPPEAAASPSDEPR